jgi:dienelactone hydrolase
MNGVSNWGVYDIAGNAREWCYNISDDKEQRYILGGGWNDPTYAFNDAGTQPALDRSLSNGFRCMKVLGGDTTYKNLSQPAKLAFRDYKKEKPVSDEIFAVYLRQYAYDKIPLSPKIVTLGDTSFCKVEKIDMDAAYGKERLTLYLYLPKNAAPPYQTIVLFSGSGGINNRVFDFRREMRISDFLLKSGRAVCIPIVKSTYERGDDLHSDLQEETIFYKQHVIAWVQDFSRSLDYLQTRNDLVKNKFGYYGFSWGSAVAPVVCAVEKRFDAAVLHVGGFMMTKTLLEVDVLNYAPRVKIPVLMLNGKNDTFYPLETSQKPMFNLLGTDVKDKSMKVYEGGHIVPRSELMKESINWFDTYLGVPH